MKFSNEKEKDDMVFYRKHEYSLWKYLVTHEIKERWEFKNFYLDVINYECS